MQRTTVMSWRDSNMAGDVWSWEIFVTSRKDGTFSVGARQRSNNPPCARVRGRYGLKTGAQLRGAIDLLFSDAFVGEDQGPDWSVILRNLRKVNRQLAKQVQVALDQEIKDQEEADAKAQKAFDDYKPIREWIQRARWARSTATGAGGIVNGVENAILRNAVTSYAELHLARHGKLPTGEHHIDDVFGSQSASEAARKRGDGIAAHVLAPKRVRLSVRFPES